MITVYMLVCLYIYNLFYALEPEQSLESTESFRSSKQKVLPVHLDHCPKGQYNIYPLHEIDSGDIYEGYCSLASFIISARQVRIDGFSGVNWSQVTKLLNEQFSIAGYRVRWFFTADFLKAEPKIDLLRKPYLGYDGSVWGRKTKLQLGDFFLLEQLKGIELEKDCDINIVIGHGASFVDWSGPLIYLEVPKNEIQYRMRAGIINNLGTTKVASYEEQYKSLYFIDWVVLRAHRESIFSEIDVLVDTQWSADLSWIEAAVLRHAVDKISSAPFRARPWFEKGVWGGQFLKNFVPGISQAEQNYAWSFELIVPENGIILSNGRTNLEIPFDLLMFLNHKNILGAHAEVFGMDFPIRFDFLDTIKGGNLSLQVHPSVGYIREHFGEKITQDETYYILECEEDASVYLGLQEGVSGQEFKAAAENSFKGNNLMELNNYIQRFSANKHDLFLIPNGTVHSAGKGNLVLEISATPYIFTFKIYDWLRLDLNGKPRPISLDHAFANIDYSNTGRFVKENLLSIPHLISSGADWEIYNYPTHAKHFYDINQIQLCNTLKLNSGSICKIMMVVEGDAIVLETRNGCVRTYNYAETFVIPSSTGIYTLKSASGKAVKLIEAFLKPHHPIFDELTSYQD